MSDFLAYELLPRILNMSIATSVVIVFVLAARLLLKKAPKVFSYALWSVVLFRLLCPFSIPTGFSLLALTDARNNAQRHNRSIHGKPKTQFIMDII